MKPSLATLPLDLLRHFHQVASHRSLSRAAHALQLTPPAITHSLARLEQAMGKKLCHRSRSGFLLTPAGEALFRCTRAVFRTLQETLDALEGENDFGGTIRVGVLINLMNDRADRLLDKMLRRFPRMRIALHGGHSREILELVRDGELQFGIGMFFPQRPVNLEFRQIGTQKLAYFVGRGHPLWGRRVLSRSDFRDLEVTWLDTERRSMAELETAIFGSHPRYHMIVGSHSDTLEGATRILLSGRAVVPLPESFLDNAPHHLRGRVKRLAFSTKTPETPIELVYDARLISEPLRFVLAEVSGRE